jgi:signal transduction histidine kinase
VTDLVLFVFAAAALILFVAFVAARLLRSRKAGMSIRMQIFIALASIVGAFALGLGVLVIDRIQARATRIAEESARAEAGSVASIVGNEMEAKNRTLSDVARDLSKAGGDLSIALLSPDGDEVFSRGLLPSAPGTVSVTAPIVASGRTVGTVRVVKPTIVVERMLADFAPTILILSVVLGAAAAASAALIGRAIAKPIETLTDFAVRVSEGERRAAPPPAQGREVQQLSRALDSMRRELEGRPFVETFAADLSHELKNPVAAIRASAEVLADGALEEPVEAARFVARIQEATGRIEVLLGELLSLARIEARGVGEAGVVDLSEIASAVAKEAGIGGAEVSVVGSSALVKGDEAWLSRLVSNLVDNARTHGKSGERIVIALEKKGEQAALVVRNQGAVSEHVRKRIFRRFVTTRPDRGGTGLGLAIVKAIAEAHGGNVDCVAFGPPEVSFRVRLPLA